MTILIFGTDYNKYKKVLSKIDINMKKSIEFGYGIRILHQDLWEMIISFIISANNNIPRIKGIIERISKRAGKKTCWRGQEYYLFPTIKELSKFTTADFRELGCGFRDKRLYKTVHMIIDKEVDIEVLKDADNTNAIREELLKLDGVRRKSC